MKTMYIKQWAWLLLALLVSVFTGCDDEDDMSIEGENKLMITDISPRSFKTNEPFQIIGSGFHKEPSQNDVKFYTAGAEFGIQDRQLEVMEVTEEGGQEVLTVKVPFEISMSTGEYNVAIWVGLETYRSELVVDFEQDYEPTELVAVLPESGYAGSEVSITLDKVAQYTTSDLSYADSIAVYFNEIEAEILKVAQKEIKVRVPKGLPIDAATIKVVLDGEEVGNTLSFSLQEPPSTVRGVIISQDEELYKLYYDEEGVKQKVYLGVMQMDDIVIDKETNMVYGAYQNRIFRLDISNPAESTTEELYNIGEGMIIIEIELDVANNMIYWIDALNGNINRAAMDGTGTPETVYSYPGQITIGAELLLSNDALYWSTIGFDETNPAVYRGDKSGTATPVKLYDGDSGLINSAFYLRSDEATNSLFISDQSLFNPAGTTLWRGSLDGKDPLEKIIDSDSGLGSSSYFTIDSEFGYIYWSVKDESNQYVIRRAKLDGTEMEGVYLEESSTWHVFALVL
ncbi:hypothetical protein V6R21_01650 [Limibacter armeniacum]|uniref:hypothetical protein n=1 Tax=Limibacter armeniacum TaxID=466084 RepID=UPI002FE51CFD